MEHTSLTLTLKRNNSTCISTRGSSFAALFPRNSTKGRAQSRCKFTVINRQTVFQGDRARDSWDD